MAKIGIIGVGNMGYTLLKGVLKIYGKKEIVFTEVNKKQATKVLRETDTTFVDSDEACAAAAKYIVLAVKPQYYDPVLANIAGALTEENVVISIAPGMSIDYLKSKLGQDKRIVRAMPNTPALLGEGMTGVSYDPALFDEEEKKVIISFFESLGKMEILPENLLDAVTCISGSSPAFVYMFIEALADGGVKYGLPRDVAYTMAAQAVAGSARMVLETEEHPGKLKDMVCSPGGTAITAVATLEECGFRNAIIKAIDACYGKCLSLKE